MPKPTFTTLANIKLFNNSKLHLFNRHKNHLCEPKSGLNAYWVVSSIPTRDKNLSLVIGIDQTNQVA
ncbi:uncharacterized protein METZ01_LOCUS134246 [marine metagenome]|uniref:Uncharacterized protein n=1 Tax=marine metagenome TaxID=408172 RepID=A0A381YXP9_9ZZZZ